MALQPGTRLGVYEVVSAIGAGGMGEVYQARDTKLDRNVAIKVLPEAFADAPDRLARFEREAKLLASLNHPYIAAIYGLEEADAVRFIVLELVPGDTLFDRLQKGPIPLEETLRLVKQIAEALEAAHAKGVIHRDLKPANVKITPDGQVKVLDFGLAKAFDQETVDGDASNSPTLSAASTKAGMILGTAANMSPEQARGIPVDKRTDIFSFGSLVFEMLTGRKTFPGELVSDTLASVIKSDPDWNGLPPSVPPRLRELLRRCLEKDPNKRRRDIGDVRVEIEEIVAGKGAPVADVAASRPAAPLWRRALPVTLALAIGTLVGTVLGIVVSRRPTRDAAVLRYSIPLPEDVRFSSTGRHIVAISPDGTRLAQAGLDGVNLIYAVEGRTIPRAAIFGEGFARDIADVHDPVKSLLYRWCIQDQWKLILTYDGATHRYGAAHPRTDRSPQLYDVIADPHETTNVATAHPEVVAWLSERIARWWEVPQKTSVRTVLQLMQTQRGSREAHLGGAPQFARARARVRRVSDDLVPSSGVCAR